jgi:hypothetical protein
MSEETVLHTLSEEQLTTKPITPKTIPNKINPIPNTTIKKVIVFLSVIAIVGGIATGTGLSALSAKGNGGTGLLTGANKPIAKVAGDKVSNGQVFGSSNEAAFKDAADGYLEAGGIDGEGSHHLLRQGGITQTVYLTSSVTDLSKFEGMCIKVWGETFKGQKAGWLMDVGRVQVIETTCKAPFDVNEPTETKTKASAKPSASSSAKATTSTAPKKSEDAVDAGE